MITELNICAFKRFANEIFALRPLTVLAGLNGSGKTSVIHSLLLTSEAATANPGEAIRLNGPFEMELGVAEEVRNWSCDEFIEFHLTSNSKKVETWKFGVPASNSLYLTVEDRPKTELRAFSNETRSFSYLCAERLGPRNVSGASPLPSESLEIGVRGEYCAQILGTLGSRPIEFPNRLHPLKSEEPTSLLKYEVERWLAEIARPVELDTIQYPGTAVTAMQFRFAGQDWVRAPNMGFGISYALPIILGGLIIQEGGLFIVENPEAHLHPAGQSRMGVFLAWLASRGVQVIVETHSDHVLNGMRRAIGEYRYLSHLNALVHFFDATEDGMPRIQRLEFTEVGGISHWPEGFFDQYQIDIASLGRVRRRG
ncbi:AAA family ATPase [Pseudomonas corrugata]